MRWILSIHRATSLTHDQPRQTHVPSCAPQGAPKNPLHLQSNQREQERPATTCSRCNLRPATLQLGRRQDTSSKDESSYHVSVMGDRPAFAAGGRNQPDFALHTPMQPSHKQRSRSMLHMQPAAGHAAAAGGRKQAAWGRQGYRVGAHGDGGVLVDAPHSQQPSREKMFVHGSVH